MRKWIRRYISSASGIRRLLNWYRPYRGAAIKVTALSKDFTYARVEMRQRWYNSNYVGTHFGGSLYSMVDPMFMLLLMRQLGPDYIVWDKSAHIDFKRPGRGRVYAEFSLTAAQVEDIKKAADQGERVLPEWQVEVMDEDNKVVARVDKTLYVKKKT
ncbi:DUF4442 domain-containing protein [Aliidiomarina soli]|uniref:Tetrameric acyl-CoA thioesterase n=1 Tax=Aliidiomarina soli TaxID=1928574 RepID=A0A432WHB0_9GAMM|nr:DUF4442 domain-containing protein [Aliidiomarina soli]RUO33168.1 tetrameric acyl-CoA thioesterase [Aliidiomarina soli]